MQTSNVAIQSVVLLVARMLLSAIFLQSSLTKPFAWEAALDEIASYGLPRSSLVLAPALIGQFLGGLGLVFGLFTRLSALGLIGFMVPATFYIHGFYRYHGAEFDHHLVGFFQNLTMSGGLVLIMLTGPGRFSVDQYLQRPALDSARGSRR